MALVNTPRQQKPRPLWREMIFLARRPRAVVRLLTGRSLDPAFRERLMLAVTQVNDCRFCSWMHAREAFKAGVDQAEINGLLDARFDDAPDDQRPALLYVQHWAETQGDVAQEARRVARQRYGAERLAEIELTARFITVMNRMALGGERLLGALSFGLFKRRPIGAKRSTE